MRKAAAHEDHLAQALEMGLHGVGGAVEELHGDELCYGTHGLVVGTGGGAQVLVEYVDGVDLDAHGGGLVEKVALGQGLRGNVERCLHKERRLDAPRHVVLEKGIVVVRDAVKRAFEVV